MQHEINQNFPSSSDLSQKGYNTGKWTPEEHKLFEEGKETLIQAYKLQKDDWAMIATFVKTRSVSQVRSHAQKYQVKRKNDEEKYKNMINVPVRQNGDSAITRKKDLIIKAQNEKEKEKKLIATPKAQPNENPLISQSEEKKLGSTSDISLELKSKEELSSEQQPPQDSCFNSETFHTDYCGSFFMERMYHPVVLRYPQFVQCPLETFSIFTLISGDKTFSMQGRTHGKARENIKQKNLKL